MPQTFLDRLIESKIVIGLTVALVIAALAAGQVGSPTLQQTFIEAEIKAILVVGLFVFSGSSGIISFVHVGFMMIGSYVTAWLTMDPTAKSLFLQSLPPWLMAAEWPLPVAIAAGTACAGAAAFIFGLVICRLSGIAASIASFALYMALFALFRQASGWTAGQSSLVGLPARLDVYKTLAGVLIAIAVAVWYERSRRGLMLKAIREDEVAARSCAINVTRERLNAFVLSGCIAGLAGGLYSQFLGILTVDMFYLDATFIALAMLMIGGWSSLAGALTGSFAVSALISSLKQAEKGFLLGDLGHVALPAGLAEVALGVILIGILIWRPKGLIGQTR